MTTYLGEKEVQIKDTKYKDFTIKDWIKLWIEMFGQYDGNRHKARCLDEIMRIVYETKVKIKIASWDDDTTEERFFLDKPSTKYIKFVEEYEKDCEYIWNNGYN